VNTIQYNIFTKSSIPLKFKPLSRPKLYADGNNAKEAKTLFSKLQSEALMANVYDYWNKYFSVNK